MKTVYLLWDERDYYGPDRPQETHFVYATREAARKGQAVLMAGDAEHASRPEVFFPIVEEEVME